MERNAAKRSGQKTTSATRRIRELEAENAKLRARMAELTAAIEELRAKLSAAQKDSSNSSKPPSSDFFKKAGDEQKSGRGKKRRAGGQPGHEKHERKFVLADADMTVFYDLDLCGGCASSNLLLLPEPKIDYQYEFVEGAIRLVAHIRPGHDCGDCDEVHYAELPREIAEGGLVGARLSAMIAYLKGSCHCSYTTIQKFLLDVHRVRLSTGMIAKVINKTSDALDPAYQELANCLPDEDKVNVDETGHRELGAKFWTWVFRAKLYSFFCIDKSRGSEVLLRVLGEEFDGLLGCDYFCTAAKLGWIPAPSERNRCIAAEIALPRVS